MDVFFGAFFFVMTIVAAVATMAGVEMAIHAKSRRMRLAICIGCLVNLLAMGASVYALVTIL